MIILAITETSSNNCLLFPQNTIAGRMAYFPIVGRLDCGSSSKEHQGFWEMHGYGIMAIYKSDWDRFGGKSTQNIFLGNTTSPFFFLKRFDSYKFF